MGVVLLAEDLELKRPVVVKVTRGVAQAELRDRAIREGRLLAEIRHPHVVEVYDAGEGEQGPYLVMEFLEGAPLSQGVPDPLTAMESVIGALEAVHRAGLVHRDLKPDNVFRCRDGRVVLVDFGLALGPGQTRLTGTGLVVGTLSFMAPETLRGHAYTPASDWYGWGATLYAILAGRPPRATEDLFAFARGEDVGPLDLQGIEDDRARAILRETLALDPSCRADGARLRELYGGAPGLLPSSAEVEAFPLASSGELPGAASEPSGKLRWLVGVAIAGVVVGLAWPAARPEAPAPTRASTAPPSEPPRQLAIRRSLEEVFPVFDALTSYPTGAEDRWGRRVSPEVAAGHIEDLLSGQIPEAWGRLVERSFRWVEALPEPALMGLDGEVEEFIWQELVPRATWLERIRTRLLDRANPSEFNLEVSAGVHVQTRERIAEMDRETVQFVDRYDIPRLHPSPVWARVTQIFVLAVWGDRFVREPEGLAERRTTAFWKAIEEGRGNPAAWRHDLMALFMHFPEPRVPSLARRFEVLRGLEAYLDRAPGAAERTYWVYSMTREAARVAGCDPEDSEKTQLAEHYWGVLREGWAGPEGRRPDFVRYLRRAAEDGRCSPSGWGKRFSAEVEAWGREPGGEAR